MTFDVQSEYLVEASPSPLFGEGRGGEGRGGGEGGGGRGVEGRVGEGRGGEGGREGGRERREG